jgi:hypothetical protein
MYGVRDTLTCSIDERRSTEGDTKFECGVQRLDLLSIIMYDLTAIVPRKQTVLASLQSAIGSHDAVVNSIRP